MRVLDLFAGLGGWSAPFRERGWSVVTLDIDPAFSPDVCADILTVDVRELARRGPFDIILASPPCDTFSVASIGRHWAKGAKGNTPKTPAARQGLAIVRRTVDIIQELKPRFWLIENPRGMMRKTAPVVGLHRITVTYCQYGESRMKPTDLWGGFPPSFIPRPPCKNGSACHEAAPRGAKTGTQGIQGSASRALIPRALALAVCIAAEQDIGAGSVAHLAVPPGGQTALDFGKER